MHALDQKILSLMNRASKPLQAKDLVIATAETADNVYAALQRLSLGEQIQREKLRYNLYAYTKRSGPAPTPASIPELRRSMIKWSRGEQQQVLKEVQRLLSATLGYSFRQAVNEAQLAVLPTSRQRTVINATGMRYLRYLYDQLLPPPPAAAVAEAPPPDEAADHAEYAAAPTQTEEAPPAFDPRPAPDPLADMLHNLIGAVSSRIAEQLLDTLTTRINDSLAQLSFRAPSPTPMGTVKYVQPSPLVKPRVVVAGLKGGQKTEIENALKNHAELRFWGVDESPHQLKHLCREADKVFLMTKFVSHSHEDIIRSIAPERLVRINGGVTMLCDTMRETLRGHLQ